MEYSIIKAHLGETIPYHLLLLADENLHFIEVYLPCSQVYLLKMDGQTRGICLLRPTGITGEIVNLAIEPACQGLGLGRALLRYVIAQGREMGMKQLLIKTGNSSVGQIALYQQEGFDLVRLNCNYFLQAYPKPIWENGIQCKHQLVFELALS